MVNGYTWAQIPNHTKVTSLVWFPFVWITCHISFVATLHHTSYGHANVTANKSLKLVVVAIISTWHFLQCDSSVGACWPFSWHVASLWLPLFITQAMAMPMSATLSLYFQLLVLSIRLVMTSTLCQGFSHYFCLRVQGWCWWPSSATVIFLLLLFTRWICVCFCLMLLVHKHDHPHHMSYLCSWHPSSLKLWQCQCHCQCISNH